MKYESEVKYEQNGMKPFLFSQQKMEKKSETERTFCSNNQNKNRMFQIWVAAEKCRSFFLRMWHTRREREKEKNKK